MSHVLYLAAPVSAPTDAGIADNLARARRWLRWLVEHTEHAICAPWMPYVESLAESRWRQRGLLDDLKMLARCDAIVLVGGRVSDGMSLERGAAHRHGLRIVSLIELGPEPPEGEAAGRALKVIREELA